MEFATSIFSPLIAIAASADVNDVLRKNNILSLSHLLEPFSTPLFSSGILALWLSEFISPVSVKDLNGQEARLDQFQVRFKDAEKLELYAPTGASQRAAEHFNQTLRSRDPCFEIQDLKRHPEQIADLGSSKHYEFYRNAVCHNIGLSEHETFNHAAACKSLVLLWLVMSN
jgi:hypothetical protein